MNDFWYFIESSGGGYGAFIWPAYGISLLGLGGATAWTWIAWRRAKAKLAMLEKS